MNLQTIQFDRNKKKRYAIVQCSYFVPVEIPLDKDYDPEFDIEENHCPGTGNVWSAFQPIFEECENKSICWACKLMGENKIITILEPENN